jgi:hypothetical protein
MPKSIGSRILNNDKFYFQNGFEQKVPLDVYLPDLLVDVTPDMTIDQAVDQIEENMEAVQFETGADLCIDIDGETWYNTGIWEKSK